MKQPTDSEKQTLREARAYYGRYWRSAIHQAWYDGNYKGFPKDWALQRMRNNPDREWALDRVKI
jgi:hypothetical protein